MSAVIRRPPPPRNVSHEHGKQRSTTHTLHLNQNDAFTMCTPESSKTCMMTFENMGDAFTFASLIEGYHEDNYMWPTFEDVVRMRMPVSRPSFLRHIIIKNTDLDDITNACTVNLLNVMNITSIIRTKEYFKFIGQITEYEANNDFYRERFEGLIRE